LKVEPTLNLKKTELHAVSLGTKLAFVRNHLIRFIQFNQ
jgi:hypothetical protein